VLDRVQAGEIVTVTVHKRPRALLVRFPLSAADAEHICARIHDIYATGRNCGEVTAFIRMTILLLNGGRLRWGLLPFWQMSAFLH